MFKLIIMSVLKCLLSTSHNFDNNTLLMTLMITFNELTLLTVLFR